MRGAIFASPKSSPLERTLTSLFFGTLSFGEGRVRQVRGLYRTHVILYNFAGVKNKGPEKVMLKQVRCPRCKSDKVESYKIGAIKFGAGCIIAALVVLWLTPHFTLVFAFVIVGVFFIYRGIKNTSDYTCKVCNKKFKL